MIHACNEIYLSSTLKNVGILFEIAFVEMKKETFCKQFINSVVAKGIENANPKYLVGKSAYELYEIITNKQIKKYKPTYEHHEEYWCGYIYCYAQWFFNCSFKRLFDVLPINELIKLYNPLHEADISKTLNIIAKLLYKEQPLKTIRQKGNLSQSELSKISGVNYRTIQAYEQGELDISKAQYDTLYSLSNSLGCEVNDIVFNYKDSK